MNKDCKKSHRNSPLKSLQMMPSWLREHIETYKSRFFPVYSHNSDNIADVDMN